MSPRPLYTSIAVSSAWESKVTGLGFAFGVRVVTAPHRWQWAVPVSHSDQICVDWIFQRRGATSPPWLPFLSQWRLQVLSPYSSKGLLKVRRDRASPGYGSLRKFPGQCLGCDPEVVWHPHLASCVATLSSPCVQCHCGLTAEIKHYFYARVRDLFSPCLALSLTGPSWLPITLPQPTSAGCSQLFPVP